mgnify:CR=1 FL=1
MNLASKGHVKSGSARGHLKGFTLIELLVVIAIIGILSAVVLASLSTARSKGKDAKIQEEMSSTRAQSEIFYGSTGNNSYDNGTQDTCNANAANSGIKPLLDTVVTDSGTSANYVDGTAGAYNKVTCHDTATAWAAEAPLSTSVSGSPAMWCVDSTGFSGPKAGTIPASTYNC